MNDTIERTAEEARLHSLGIDIALNKGDVLTAQLLGTVVKLPHQSPAYNLAILKLRKTLETMLADRGKPATVAIVSGDLRILTDDEAAEYNHQVFRHGLRKARRAYLRLLAVDAGRLNPAQNRDHLRNITVDGTILSAIDSTRAKCRRMPLIAPPNGHPRATPGLPGN